ncbi:MAG: DUF3568 family protein [Opitutaceae bacterium]|jgi:hypothetical protein|nr:DUF3568 family protein [Opitutaceae bacterium]
MRRLRLLAQTAAASAALLALAACSTIRFDNDGRHTAVWQLRTLSGLVNGNNDAAFAAAEKAVRQLDLYTVSSAKEQFSSKLVLRAPGDKRVTVAIAETNSLQTRVDITWGAAGNRTASVALYEAILKNTAN